MATQHTRLLSKVFNRQLASSTTKTSIIQRRFYEREGETGAPYRPWPMESFFWPTSAEHWTKTYPTQSAKADEYSKEEVYLDEIEARMRKYDKKYAMTDKVKNLYNEYGWENQDDRAFTTYGGGLSGENDELQYGRGKKIDPAQYINPDFTATTRKPIPPVEYMTAEQIRRSRGSLANYRELPPEQPSIWKYWNLYSTGSVVFALLVAKEFFILGGHDMWDALMYWGIFGVAGSAIGDWMAWWHAIVSQEHYDREYFMMNERVEQLNAEIEALASKPNERRLLLNLVAYRDQLSEKVLQRTLSNRITRLLDSANRKLADKLSEEAGVRKNAEAGWQKEALETTLGHFDDAKVRSAFMQDAVKQFCAPNAASLKTTTPNLSSDAFKTKYDASYQNARNNYLQSEKSKGTLSWVFADKAERAKLQMSKKDKESEFSKRVKTWEANHNSVNAALPAFA